MKSIKEKAIEVFPRHCNANTDYSNFKKRIGFNCGANYVLEEIEKMMPSSDDVIDNHTRCKSAIFRLQTIIEQLKKK